MFQPPLKCLLLKPISNSSSLFIILQDFSFKRNTVLLIPPFKRSEKNHQNTCEMWSSSTSTQGFDGPPRPRWDTCCLFLSVRSNERVLPPPHPPRNVSPSLVTRFFCLEILGWVNKEPWEVIKGMVVLYIIVYVISYMQTIHTCIHMSNGLNLLHPRKDVAEMVIVFCVSLIVPEDLMFAIKSGEHVYRESSFFVSPLSFLRVSWWYQVSMSWCNCSKMSEVLAGAHIYITMPTT